MDARKNASVLQEKTMSIKFLVLGGGYFGFEGRGGSADFIFMGAGIFLMVAQRFARANLFAEIVRGNIIVL